MQISRITRVLVPTFPGHLDVCKWSCETCLAPSNRQSLGVCYCSIASFNLPFSPCWKALCRSMLISGFPPTQLSERYWLAARVRRLRVLPWVGTVPPVRRIPCPREGAPAAPTLQGMRGNWKVRPLQWSGSIGIRDQEKKSKDT